MPDRSGHRLAGQSDESKRNGQDECPTKQEARNRESQQTAPPKAGPMNLLAAILRGLTWEVLCEVLDRKRDIRERRCFF